MKFTQGLWKGLMFGSILVLSLARGSYAVQILEPINSSVLNRADVIGFGGLVPDEQNDLNYNPAYINSINGKRIFGGLNSAHERFLFGGGSTSDSRSLSFAPSFEYLHDFSNSHLAIRFTGNHYGNTFESSFSTISTLSRLVDFRTIYGWLNMGLSLAGNINRQDSSSQSFFSGNTSSISEDRQVSGAVGFIFGADHEERLGVMLQGSYGQVQYFSSSTMDVSHYTITSRITPEMPLTKKTSIRGLFSISYKEVIDRDYPTLNYQLGAGWMIQPQEGTLWSLGLLNRGIYSKTSSAKTFNDNVLFRIGLEKKLLSDRLILRGSVDTFQYDFNDSSSTSSSSRFWSIKGPIVSYRLGAGIQLSKSLLFDVSFDQLNSNYGESSSQFSGFSLTESSSIFYRIGFLTTYKF